MKNWLHSVGVAFGLLTIIPVSSHIRYTEQTMTQSVVFYPFVGIVAGGAAASAGLAAYSFLPPLPASVIVLCVWVLITGGLHLDGLMDSADGLLSRRSRERMLEIMRDSRVGAMGVMVCVLHLLLKLALLFSLFESLEMGAAVVILAAVFSRCAVVWAIVFFPYVRDSSGMGGPYRLTGTRHVAAATFAAGAIAAAVVFLVSNTAAGLGNGLEYYLSLIVIGVCVIAALIVMIGWYARKKLGGLTGDVYGAMIEGSESVFLLAAASLMFR